MRDGKIDSFGNMQAVSMGNIYRSLHDGNWSSMSRSYFQIIDGTNIQDNLHLVQVILN